MTGPVDLTINGVVSGNIDWGPGLLEGFAPLYDNRTTINPATAVFLAPRTANTLSNTMELKKSPKADLENKKTIFRQIGLVFTLAILHFGFEWKCYEKTTSEIQVRQVADVPEEIIPITEQKIEVAPPPPVKQVVKIHIVEDDVNVEDDLNINVEADQNTEVEEYVPTKVEVEDEESAEERQIFMVVESMPAFPGGEAALHQYQAENIKYPQMAKESGIQGRVFVTFVVERDGSLGSSPRPMMCLFQ